MTGSRNVWQELRGLMLILGSSGDTYHNSLEQFIGFVEFMEFVGLKRQSAVESPQTVTSDG